MDYDLIVVKTLERVYKNYYYIIRGENKPSNTYNGVVSNYSSAYYKK